MASQITGNATVSSTTYIKERVKATVVWESTDDGWIPPTKSQ